MTFSPQQALKYAQNISQPRRAGSEGERCVAEEITHLLQGFGYDVEHHPFHFISALHGWIKVELACSAMLVLAILLLQTTSPWAPILPAILLLTMILLVNPLHHWVIGSSLLPGDQSTVPLSARILSWLGPQFKSNNIVVRSPDFFQQDDSPSLFLVAHYDSKSQVLPLPIRILCFTLYILGGVSTSILTILSLIFPELTASIPYFVWGSLIFVIPLLFMGVGNNSPGAIDNASGVGLVLHMAEILAGQKDLLQNLRVTFLFTAAEEEGLMGAQAYAIENISSLRQQAQGEGLHILNFDGIGTQGNLLMAEPFRGNQITSGISLAEWMREICSELGYSLGRFPPIGALMDHIPFVDQELDAISLATGGKAAWSVHTASDATQKLHPNGFEQAGQVALKLIEKLSVQTEFLGSDN